MIKRSPRLYFSFRSPYSWMTVERLRRELPREPHEVIEFVPFWDPDEKTAAALAERGAGFHYTQMSKAKHLYILQDTKRLSGRLGLTMAWPIDVDPWWELPHLAWLRASRAGLGREFYDAVIAARWERGEDVCRPDVLQRSAQAVGLDGDLLVSAADDAEVQAEAIDCLAAAWDDDVFGVPYLRLGRQRFWGIDRLDLFLEAFVPNLEGLSDDRIR